MKYDQYIATGYSPRGIAVSTPQDEPQKAAQAFFKDYPYVGHCLIKRVSVRLSGNVVFDPNFETYRIDKNNA